LVKLLQERVQDDDDCDLKVDQIASYPPLPPLPGGPTATASQVLADFNAPANSDGSSTAIMVADSNEASEGLSFMSVRRLYLANAPSSWLEYQQVVGRAVRSFSHHALVEPDRTVTVKVYIGTLCDVNLTCAECSSACSDYAEETTCCWQCQRSECQKWLCSKACRKRHTKKCKPGMQFVAPKLCDRKMLKQLQTVEQKLCGKLLKQLQDSPPLRKFELAAIDRETLQMKIPEIRDCFDATNRLHREARLRRLQRKRDRAAENHTKASLEQQLQQLQHKLEDAGGAQTVTGICWACQSDSAVKVVQCSCQHEGDNEGLCGECFDVHFTQNTIHQHTWLRTNRVMCFNKNRIDCVEVRSVYLCTEYYSLHYDYL
jgi:hypothetical protein